MQERPQLAASFPISIPIQEVIAHVFGLLNLNKPAGLSSRAAINQIQKLVKPAKIGHAGTLDPIAHGVLIVTIGPATRLTQRIQAWSKTYRGTFLLGRSSDTEDIEGVVSELPRAAPPTLAQLEAALPSLTGEIQQVPPAYSALKIKGRRAYELAREGVNVELKPRTVTIHSLSIVSYDYPTLVVDVECGSGTYIRSLGRDLAERVETAAVMSDLQRTSIGPFHIDESVGLDEITRDTLPSQLESAALAVQDLPHWPVDDVQIREIGFGREINCPALTIPEAAAISESGDLIAILIRLPNGRYRSRQSFRVR